MSIKKKLLNTLLWVLILVILSAYAKKGQNTYTLPAEWEQQESIWLQWPHDNTYMGYLRSVREKF